MVSTHIKIEETLCKYFQRNIKMYLDNELMKTGKLLLIKNHLINNNFFFEMIVEKTKKIDSFKIPYPFKWEEYPDDSLILLDYRIKSLSKSKEMQEYILNVADKYIIQKPSKYFNKILEIQFE